MHKGTIHAYDHSPPLFISFPLWFLTPKTEHRRLLLPSRWRILFLLRRISKLAPDEPVSANRVRFFTAHHHYYIHRGKKMEIKDYVTETQDENHAVLGSINHRKTMSNARKQNVNYGEKTYRIRILIVVRYASSVLDLLLLLFVVGRVLTSSLLFVCVMDLKENEVKLITLKLQGESFNGCLIEL